jgi:hypothetical protein
MLEVINCLRSLVALLFITITIHSILDNGAVI